jgi:hypothetical protein
MSGVTDSVVHVKDAGFLLLPGGNVPVHQISLRRNELGQMLELIVHFDPSMQARLYSQATVILEFRATGEQIEIPVPDHFREWPEEALRQGIQHLQVTMLGQGETRKIERFLRKIAPRERNAPSSS